MGWSDPSDPISIIDSTGKNNLTAHQSDEKIQKRQPPWFYTSGQISSRPHTTDFPQMVVKSKGDLRLFQGNRSVGEIF